MLINLDGLSQQYESVRECYLSLDRVLRHRVILQLLRHLYLKGLKVAVGRHVKQETRMDKEIAPWEGKDLCMAFPVSAEEIP